MSSMAETVVDRRQYRNLLPGLFILALLVISLQLRVAAAESLVITLRAAAGLLAGWFAYLLVRARLQGKTLEIEFVVVRTHYVQALVQSSVYLYWATAWPFIAGQFVLIFAQMMFAYACTLLLAWTRRSKCEIGFGPMPIILSTNFFMCFKDEWFFLQFAMISVGIFGKEFIRWKRDGRMTHIFNPSAFGLFVFSVAILLTQHTDLTWAQEIAIELGRPKYIFVYIFLVGLVVQYLFHVTLVTLAAASMLLLLNLAYTAATGIYWFLDAGIPIAVFLGLHLLVTDPATSPHTNYGRAIFGALYGAGVFVLYALLEWAGAPRFYDKLLFVPVLNLLVPVIDGYARRSRLPRIAPFSMIAAQTPRRQNLIFMGIWIALFTTMYATHFLGPGHPGGLTAFWELACTENRHNACRNLRAIHWDNCRDGNVAECVALGDAVERSGPPPEDALLGSLAIAHACDLFDRESCRRLDQTMRSGGASGFEARCNSRNAQACYVLGTVHLMGLGTSPDRAAGFRFFDESCDLNLPTGCGVVAESYRYGVGTTRDMPRAVSAYEKACAGASAPACMQLAQLLVAGEGVPRNERRGLALFAKACRLGLTDACAAR